MVNGDIDEYNAVINELSKDENYGPLMEIVTGHYGVEYAEMMPFIELLLERPEYMPQRIGLGKAFRDIRKSIMLRERAVLNVAETLTKLVMIRAGSRNPKPKKGVKPAFDPCSKLLRVKGRLGHIFWKEIKIFMEV